jgi:hypothetical protein
MMGINGAFQNEPKSNKLTQKINRLFKEYWLILHLWLIFLYCV